MFYIDYDSDNEQYVEGDDRILNGMNTDNVDIDEEYFYVHYNGRTTTGDLDEVVQALVYPDNTFDAQHFFYSGFANGWVLVREEHHDEFYEDGYPSEDLLATACAGLYNP